MLATSFNEVSSWTSVKIGTPICFLTFSRILKPVSIPTPRKLECAERFALSKEDL
jgi:hypothetical protein